MSERVDVTVERWGLESLAPRMIIGAGGSGFGCRNIISSQQRWNVNRRSNL